MDREQINKIYSDYLNDCESEHDMEHIFTLAYKAIPSAEPKWIPVSERLPEENTDVLLGLRNGDKFKYFVSRRVDYNYWVGLGRDISDEIRWMPLPKLYEPQKSEDKE